MKLLSLLRVLAMALAITCLALPGVTGSALAQAVTDGSTTVSLPFGQWLTAAGDFIIPIVAAAALWLIRKLPSQIAALLMTMRVEQMLTMAIKYAINAVAGASHDKPLTLDLGNAVAAKAVQYVIDHAPGWLVSWAGDAEGLREKIIARLNLNASAALS